MQKLIARDDSERTRRITNRQSKDLPAGQNLRFYLNSWMTCKARSSIYLDMIAARMGGDEHEARQQAIASFSGLMGAIMLCAVKKSDPTLSNELLSSARKVLKLKN